MSVRTRQHTRWMTTLALLGLLGAEGSFAQTPALDVPYVPTPQPVVDRMLEMGKVSKDDFVIDLGSGDGRIPITAAKKYGARGFGVDLNPVRVREAQEGAQREGVSDKVTFREQNLFQTDISKADVLTMYLLPRVNMELRPRVLNELRPGTRVVSHAFDMGDWIPDDTATVEGRQIYLWIVPAKVEGRWQVRDGNRTYTLSLDQSFQKVSGTAEIDGRSQPIRDGQLRGEELRLTIDMGSGGSRTLQGRVTGDRIEARSEQGAGSSGSPAWTATRQQS